MTTSTLSNVTISNTGNISGTVTIGGAGTSYYTSGTGLFTGAGVGGSSGTVSISSGGNYTIGAGAGVSTISIPPLTADQIVMSITPDEWVGRFPYWDRIQKMCDEYPGLKIAFEKFKTTYMLVRDDYDTPPDQRAKP
jgi:hypothetical protein